MNDIKNDLLQIIGKQNITEDSKLLELYSKDESFVHSLEPWFVVKPKNAEEVQKLIQWANQSTTPLVPVSSGSPHFRGDTVPSTPGAVMVDLSGMKRIIHVDSRNRMVIVEPGVTYSQLQPELAKAGLRLSSPLMPRSNKSVIASLLEREPVIIPRYQWAMLDPLRCLEVVWGDGQKMTTGEAGSAGTLEEEWARKFAQVAPAGPGQTDFYKFASAAQGSMGIVTWASLKCEILPQIHKLFFVPSRKLDDLLGLAYAILRIRFGDELLLLNNWNLAAMLGKDSKQIKALAEQLPQWMLLIGIAGRDTLPEEKVAYQEKDVSEMAQKDGLQLLPAVSGASGDEVLQAILNPSPEPYWKLRYKGGCQDIFFLTTLEKTPEFVKTMYSVAESYGYPTSEIGIYIQPVHQGASCHCEFDIAFDRSNPREVNRIKELYTKASEELLQKGAYYSRPYGIWADMAFNRDAQTTAVLKKVKGIFDPNNVMNPGKLCF
jgi:FAD/FMN-containing dehydrogenase